MKVKPKIDLNTGEKKKQTEKVEDMRVNELASTIAQSKEQTKQLSGIITTLCAPRCPNEENLVRRKIEKMSNKTKKSAEETEK